MLEKLKNIHKYETVVFISILISLLTGIIPSLILLDWSWFSRSGALLVIFGVYIVWLDYQSDVNNDLDIVLSGFNKHLTENTKEDDVSIKKIETEVSNKFDEVRAATKKRFQNIEFFIVAVGTLIWGYGDLFNKFLVQSC